MSVPLRVGIIGCGNISQDYLVGLRQFPALDVVACADIDLSRAEAAAARYKVPRFSNVADLLAAPDIECVVNLTVPAAHFPVCLAALEAGKHVYVEKPFSVTLEQGNHLLEVAEKKGLYVGAAPDTFLGAAHQTARKAIDDGLIGRPIAAMCFMLIRGNEHWHPNPQFFYQPGGGPMFDMGPYYLANLVQLIGPIRRVAAMAGISFPERTVGSGALAGTKFTVETPTHISGSIEFKNGAIGTIVTSFDVLGNRLPNIEIYGTEGSLRVPDPNRFGGEVQVFRQEEKEWRDLPLTHDYVDDYRGMGLADMANAIRGGNHHRASGALGNHVLEAMTGFLIAAESGQHYEMQSYCERPQALPQGLPWKKWSSENVGNYEHGTC